MNPTEIVKLPSRSGRPIKIKLRWGVQKDDLLPLWDLHNAAFPVKYDSDYYEWLLSDSCLAIIAFTTPDCIIYQLNNGEHDGRTGAEGCTQSSSSSCHVEPDESSSVYSVMIGFCIGQIAHGIRRDGTLRASPTGYLGSFAVNKRMQGCGVGELILHRFLSYMLCNVPIQPHFFLDNTPPPFNRIGLFDFRSILITSLMRLSGWWYGKEPKKKRKHEMERALGNTKAVDSMNSSSTTTSQQQHSNNNNGEDQRGLDEVWLHCLASDTKLVKYYLKRGFSCVLVAPDFYTFNGSRHDGMLLVYRRDCLLGIQHDSNGKCMTEKQNNRISFLGSSAAEESNKFKFRRCDAVLPKQMEGANESATDIVDMLLTTESAKLSEEWDFSVRGSNNNILHWGPFSSRASAYFLEVAVTFICVTSVVTFVSLANMPIFK